VKPEQISPFSRRDFLKLLALAGAAAALPAGLAACSAADDYNGLSQKLWQPDFQTNTDMKQQMLDLIHFASLAPSGHNTQPWKFSLAADQPPALIRLYPDHTRRLPAVDPDERELYISLGCALENLLIAARQAGYEERVEIFPSDEADCVRVQLAPTGAGAPTDPLFAAITERQCTRSLFDGQPAAAADLDALQALPAQPGTRLAVLIEPKAVQTCSEAVAEGNRRQFQDQAFLDELITWIRFNEKEALKTRDGLYTLCSGNPKVPRWLGKLFLTPGSANSQVKSDTEKIASSAGLVLLSSQADDPQSWLETGRTFERLALTLTSLGMRMAFVNQPVEISALRQQLAPALGLEDAVPQLLLRFGRAPAMPHSLRRPIAETLM